MKDYVYSFEYLEVWQLARKLVMEVYSLLKKFPLYEKFGLCDQIRRAIISVPSNIAESCRRTSFKGKIHFIEISYGSLMETFCQLILATDLSYITPEEMQSLKPKFYSINKLLNGLRRSYIKQLESASQHKTTKPLNN